ncbi:16704_t:CDS:2 [Funneliformis caledonium]|uniref:16704_t:CDS:1 n=1 Tax=Funneliformis caledonium TaxID=1117310 RepID=A0A9N9H9J1_9GLOM|nr:16704_t:CDS:2 [Funneliformis caledonium]
MAFDNTSVNAQDMITERALIYLHEYHIIYKEIPSNDALDYNTFFMNDYVITYYHLQGDLNKSYEVICRKIRLYQYQRNYIEFQQFEQQCQQDIVEQLKLDLTGYLSPNYNSLNFFECPNIFTEKETGQHYIVMDFPQLVENQFQGCFENKSLDNISSLDFQSYEERSSEIETFNEIESQSNNAFNESESQSNEEKHKKMVWKLPKRGLIAHEVKETLWEGASRMLNEKNHNFTAGQCATKYKNLKQNKDKEGSKIWKLEIEEIIN